MHNYLVVDEAHSYSGSTGTEVSMLIKRFKAAVGIESMGQMQGIATSATLGDREDPKALEQVTDFARDLFGEDFDRVVWGDRITVEDRLKQPYRLPEGLSESEVYEHFYDLELLSLSDPISQWRDQLIYLVPNDVLETAVAKAEGDTHRFLWFALSQHPTLHKLIDALKRPQPWNQLARSPQLWTIPKALDGSIPIEEEQKLERALSHLVQLGTLARAHPDELPLLPVRLHLLFRSIEGLYACVNPHCSEAAIAPTLGPLAKGQPNRYGKLYLNSKSSCECCASPVIELASCRKCGQAYGLTYLGHDSELQLLPRSLEAVENSSSIHVLTAGGVDSVTNDEGSIDEDEDIAETDENIGSFAIYEGTQNSRWMAKKSKNLPVSIDRKNKDIPVLHWHRPAGSKNLEGRFINKCPACSAGRSHTAAIRRFVSYTDAPLEVMLDSLFELLPEPDLASMPQHTKRKLLTFSDGRQDAAFFASDFQRTHTETLYRQLVWQAFKAIQSDGVASVSQVQEQLSDQLLELSIPHPDRDPNKHHRSYVANDTHEEASLNLIDCKKRAQSRAKELLVREFALPSARRFSIEALGLLACHLQDFKTDFLNQVTQRFELNAAKDYAEARIFLTGLTNIIRLTGAIDLLGTSCYFPETGGIDGGQPARLDSKGRSQSYLKLEKAPEDKNAISFLWKKTKKGELAKQQNQIVSYYQDFLGKLPPPETLEWLFRELSRQNIFVKYNDGYQLHWELFNLKQTAADWYQCSTCQQISHVPCLAAVKGTSKKGVDLCLAPKCKGALQPLPPDQLLDHHYRHLIQEREVLPLRSQEHTAQLGTEELSNRENRFRQGKINLLSCSTTLEMGVDIGELQVVALRNFPPHVSNYQQRAGRAGRRTDGVAITLMYGQRRPHDRYYFEQPIQLIDGKNQVPKLDPTNFEIQKRHIRAELLANFLRAEQGTGAEKVLIADFLGLPNNFTEMAKVSNTSVLLKLVEWLSGSPAIEHTQRWLTRLESEQSEASVLGSFKTDLQAFKVEQLKDWNGLAGLLKELKQSVRQAEDANDKKQKLFEYKRDRVRDELEKIQKRQLHESLAKASILPIYGFPIDVVQLLTSDTKRFNKGQGKHRLQRDRRLALGEYAPGQKIVVDDRVHSSVGLLRPEDLLSRYYWVCQSCNYFKDASTQEEIANRLGIAKGNPKCPVCLAKLSPTEQKAKSYKIPKAFVTDWSEQPKVTPYRKPTRQPTSQVFLAQEGDSVENKETNFFNLIVSQGGKFFLSNQGPLQNGRGFKNQGFAICKSCGRDLSEEVRQQQRTPKRRQSQSSRQISHHHPITGSACKGWYEYTHLGHEFRSDLLKIQFLVAAQPPNLFGEIKHFDGGKEILSENNLGEGEMTQPSGGTAFWRSLTYALLAAAAQIIDVPRFEVDGLFRPLEDSAARTVELIIYDNVPGGAGYSKRIANRFSDVLKRAYQLSTSCSCSSSCYDCLRTYTNQAFHHELDRHQVSEFLAPIVERLQPDESLKSFAPDANRVSLLRMDVLLERYCTVEANPSNILYLPKIAKPFTLQWLTNLIQSVDSTNPLEILVTNLPAVENNDYVRVLRKRLSQWIDQGLLRLYTTHLAQTPTLCLNNHSPHQVALELQTDSTGAPVEWFQTRSENGVGYVYEQLQQLKTSAKPVPAVDLEDTNTAVVFPIKAWGCMAIAELRERLGLSQVLAGNNASKIVCSDRYLNCNEHPGAEILAALLLGDWIDKNTRITIFTQQTRDEADEAQDPRNRNAQQRCEMIEKSFSILAAQTSVEIRQRRSRQPQRPLPHGRELNVVLEDGSEYRILFDKGMAFIEKQAKNLYCIKESTYVAIVKV